MPIKIQEQFCPSCGGCCVEGCLNEIKCLYECCGCCTIEVCFGPNLKLSAGTIVAENKNDLRFYAFDPNNEELDKPVGILRYTIETDEDGNLTHKHAPLFANKCNGCATNVYICGIFRTQELHGNVAAATSYNRFETITGTPYSNGIFGLAVA